MKLRWLQSRSLKPATLTIGLGRDLSVLNFIRGDKNPPYMISKRELESDNVMEFRFGEELSEYLVRNCIPITNAREVVRHFCETGLLSQTIEWEVV